MRRLRLHTATLVVSFFLTLLLTLAVEHPAYLLSILVVIIAAFAQQRAFWRWKTMLIFSSVTALLIVAINVFVSRNGNTILFQSKPLPVYGPLLLTLESASFSLVAGLKLIIACSLFPLFSCFSRGDATFSLAARFCPKSALLVSLSTLLLPRLQRRFEETRVAMQMRGASRGLEEPSRKVRVRSFAQVLKIVLCNALEDAWTISESLYSRGFSRTSRSTFSKEKFRRVDFAVLSLQAACFSVLAFNGFFQTGLAYFPTLAMPWNTETLAGIILVLLSVAPSFLIEQQTKQQAPIAPGGNLVYAH